MLSSAVVTDKMSEKSIVAAKSLAIGDDLVYATEKRVGEKDRKVVRCSCSDEMNC